MKSNASAKSLDPNAKLSMLERIGYGLGDYSGNLVYSAISAFLVVYYVSVVHADPKIAASIIAVSKIFDGISDLIMGYIVDHTHSKWGKARPWIARLCVPLAISTVFMFSVPASASDKVQIVYMFLTYNLVSTVFYTGINVPYATMNGLMTTNQYERGLLGNFRMLFATAGTMTINTFVLKMTTYFGGGDQYSQKGWTITFIILMVIFAVLNMVTFLTCKERVNIEESESDNKKNVVPLGKQLKALFTNKYWLLLVVCLFVMYFMMSCFYSSALYYAQFNLEAGDKYSTISNVLSIAQIVTMLLTPFIMKKVSKRNLFLVGMTVAALGFIGTGLVGKNVTLVIVLSAVKGIGFGCGAATMFGLLQDSITYGEWKSGYDITGMGNAASSFCMKVGSGFGTAALGWVLDAGKFVDTATVQSESALQAISANFVWIPAVTMIIAVVCLLAYNLTPKKYEMIANDLANGRHKGDPGAAQL